MRLLPALSLLLLSCGHGPALPLVPGGRVFDESEYAADVRARILRRNADVYACYQEAAAARPLQSPEASAGLRYSRDPKAPGYTFEKSPEASGASTASSTPFALAFEQCLGPRVAAWLLPKPVGSSVSARFFFLPPGAPVPAAPDLATAKLNYGEQPSMDPAWSSPLFDEEGVRGFVDVAEMTLPRLLTDTKVHYTQEALAQRVEGRMLMKCLLTREGTLRDCEFPETLPLLEPMVRETYAAARYSPVVYRGRKVDVTFTFTFVFQMPKP